MPVFVKAHSRRGKMVSAYTRRRWGGTRNPGRLEEIQRRLDSSMQTRRTLSGGRKCEIDRTIHRLQSTFEAQAAAVRRYNGQVLPGRIQAARAAGARARQIQAHRSEILSRRGW